MTRALAGFLCSLSLAAADPSGPGEAAITFLSRLKAGELDLRTQTALSPGATDEKVASIRLRLDRLGDTLGHGDLAVLEQRTDADLAGVLVSQVSDFDPSTAQVHAIGLLRRDDTWVPAPVPASFENTGIRYHPDLGAAASRLEAWMLNERPARLQHLHETLDGDLLAAARRSLSPDELLETPPGTLVTRFLAACRKRDLPQAVAFLGGLENPVPANWSELVSQVAGGLRAADEGRGIWAELLDPLPLEVVVHTELNRDDAEVSLGRYNPAEARPGREGIEIRQFTLQRRTGGPWRLRLPEWLITGSPEQDAPPDLEAEVPLALIRQCEARAFDSPHALGDTLMQELGDADFTPLLSLIRATDRESAMLGLSSYAHLWRHHRHSQHLRLLLDVHQEGDRACGIYCQLDPYNPEIRQDLIRKFLMIRGADGWQLAPDASPASASLPAPLLRWFQSCLERTRTDWLHCLGLDRPLGGIPADSAPGEPAVTEAAQAWTEALESREPRRILQHVTLFDTPGSVRQMFSFLGQELPSQSSLEVLKVHRHGRWAAASIRHQPPGEAEPPTDLLHPIVGSSSGPKILAEAVLYTPDTRARQLLNNDAWKRLGEHLPEEAVNELRQLLDAHTKLSQPAETTDE